MSGSYKNCNLLTVYSIAEDHAATEADGHAALVKAGEILKCWSLQWQWRVLSPSLTTLAQGGQVRDRGVCR
jgi:hypothetical protein